MLSGADVLPALGLEGGVDCPNALEKLRARAEGLGLGEYAEFLKPLLGGGTALDEAAAGIAVELLSKSLSEGVNYVAQLYVSALLAVRDACPDRLAHAAALLAVVGFDVLWQGLKEVTERAGVEPAVLKALFSAFRRER